MKKFSKVKYFGAVAAALLAVAPIAAPVVSQVASPAVVQAATSPANQTAANAANTLAYTLKDTSSISRAQLIDSNFYGTFLSGQVISEQWDITTNTYGKIFNHLLNSNTNNSDLAGYRVKLSVPGYKGYTAKQLAHDLAGSGKSSFSVKVTLYAGTDTDFATPLASKTVTLTVPAATAQVSGVSSVSDATVALGSSVTPFTTYASIVGSTKFALSDGSTRDAVPSDFKEFVGFTKLSRAGIDPKVTEKDGDGSVTGSTFTTPGTYYVLFELSDTLSDTLTDAGTTQTVSLRKNNSGNWYVARKVVVGDYTESAATGTANVVNGQGTTVYSDPTTTTSTGKTLDYGSAWKVYGVVKNSAGTVLAYNLGGKQYVKASDVSSTAVSNQAGVFTVKYPSNPTWSIAVYNSDLKVQKLIPAGSTWTTFGVKTLKDGKSYYNVGGDQWVRTDYGYWNAK